MQSSLLHFEEESRLVTSTSAVVLPSEAADAGRVFAESMKREEGRTELLVAHSGEKGSEALAEAFAAGAASSGADCVFAGACCATAAAYAARELGCVGGCYVHTEITASFRLFGSDGLPLSGETEAQIEKHLGTVSRIPYSHYGKMSRFMGADRIYSERIRKLLPVKLNGINAVVSSSSPSVLGCCDMILEDKNDRLGDRLSFHISGDGMRISVYTEETGYVFREKLVLLCLRDLFEKGIDAAVCGRPFRAAEKLAGQYGRKIISCHKSICSPESRASGDCIKARKLSSEQLFMQDGIALMARTLEILSRSGKTLGEEIAKLPPCVTVNRFIPADSPSELLKKLCTGTDDGLVSDSTGGRVVIRPVRTGKGIMLSVESYAAEAANELCDFYTELAAAGGRR